MPASERSFGDPLPDPLYLDVDLVVSALINTQPYYAQARRFFDRLYQQRTTILYLPSLTWLELLQVIRRDTFRRLLPDRIQREFDLARWERAEVRSRYVQWFLDSPEMMLSRFQWTEIELTAEIRIAATQCASADRPRWQSRAITAGGRSRTVTGPAGA